MMINPSNPIAVHIPSSLPGQEADGGTSTTINTKIYSKKNYIVFKHPVALL
jgi:hypothetical protein